MYSLEEACNLNITNVHEIYKLYSNIKLPDIYKKYIFGQEIIDRAKGEFLYTRSGKKILDLTGGLGVANFGHNHDRLLEVRRQYALKERPEIHKSYLNPILAAASKNLSDIAKHDLKYSFFCNSGAESIDGALKLSYKRYGGKRRYVLHSDRSFHGKTIGAGSISAGDNFVGGKSRFFFQKIAGTSAYHFDDVNSVKEQINEIGGHNIYAIFVEPISCSTLTPSSLSFLKNVRALCDKYGITLVYDEIYSGFGKCGEDFYFHKTGVAPDIMCISKSLGGGKASTSAYITNKKVYEEAYGSVSGALAHSTTYNSFGEECATVLESCNILIEEKISEKSKHIEQYLQARLSEMVRDSDIPVLEVRGAGTHFGIILENPFKVLQPVLELLPIDYTSDPLFTRKLYTTAVINALWENANVLTAFTSNMDVILNISPAPITDVKVIDQYMPKIESVLKENAYDLVIRIIKNGLVKL